MASGPNDRNETFAVAPFIVKTRNTSAFSITNKPVTSNCNGNNRLNGIPVKQAEEISNTEEMECHVHERPCKCTDK